MGAAAIPLAVAAAPYVYNGIKGLVSKGGGDDQPQGFDSNATSRELAAQMGYQPGQMVQQDDPAPLMSGAYGGGTPFSTGAPGAPGAPSAGPYVGAAPAGAAGNLLGGTEASARGLDPQTAAALQGGALDGLKNMGWLSGAIDNQRMANMQPEINQRLKEARVQRMAEIMNRLPAGQPHDDAALAAAEKQAAQEVTEDSVRSQIKTEQDTARANAAGDASQQKAFSEGSAYYDDTGINRDRAQLSQLAGYYNNRQLVGDIAGPQASQYEGDQRSLVNRLSDPNYVSPAQLQMQLGLQSAEAAQASQAAARPGALSQRQAMLNGAAMSQRVAGQGALMRSQEDLNRQSLLSTTLGNYRGQDLAADQLRMQTGVANQDARLRQASTNDAASLDMIHQQLGLGAQTRANHQRLWEVRRNYQGTANQAQQIANQQSQYDQNRRDNQISNLAAAAGTVAGAMSSSNGNANAGATKV